MEQEFSGLMSEWDGDKDSYPILICSELILNFNI